MAEPARTKKPVLTRADVERAIARLVDQDVPPPYILHMPDGSKWEIRPYTPEKAHA